LRCPGSESAIDAGLGALPASRRPGRLSCRRPLEWRVPIAPFIMILLRRAAGEKLMILLRAPRAIMILLRAPRARNSVDRGRYY
jgi:hypothetical protein